MFDKQHEVTFFQSPLGGIYQQAAICLERSD